MSKTLVDEIREHQLGAYKQFQLWVGEYNGEDTVAEFVCGFDNREEAVEAAEKIDEQWQGTNLTTLYYWLKERDRSGVLRVSDHGFYLR